MLLYEKWRPATLDAIIGQDESVKRLIHVRDTSGWVGQVLWFVGPPGGGKTSASRIIAAEVSSPYRPISINAQRLTLETLREFDAMCRMKPLGAAGHAFVIDESHLLRGPLISELQTVLEEPHVQRTSTWLFTTTLSGQQRLFDTKLDTEAFLSRAKRFEFNTHGHELDFAMHVQRIAQAEGLDGQPLAAYVELVRNCRGNMRQCLQEIEAGCMCGK